MKNRLILIISLILVCCKGSEEIEIEENIESVEEIKKYEVSIISTNGGTVNVSSGTYNAGTILNLIATPNEGFKFTSWTGYESNENSISLTINSDISLIANFERVPENNPNNKVIFNKNIHNSLPQDWIKEHNNIMDSLDIIIPTMATNYAELDIYAWNSNANKPYSSIIGDQGGACICGNEIERFMVLEIPEDEFTFESMHRYSVIPHEMFHAYQMSISKNFNDGDFRIKWLSEGTAASFESIYVQQNYSYNYFKFDQNRVDLEVLTSPQIFENYDSTGDVNYSSSVFMTLVLAKELQKNNISEQKAFELIFRSFLQKNPNDENWKNIFEEVFSISVESFYSSISNYTNDIKTVLPSENLSLQSIFQLSNENYTIKVTSPDSDDYILNGKDTDGVVEGRDPKVTVKLGDTLTFDVDAFGHPFYLKTVQGLGTEDLVVGAENNGIESGTVVWTPTKKGTFYYQCSLHYGMYGEIIVE